MKDPLHPTQEELIALLQQGSEAWNTWRSQNLDIALNFKGCKFHSAGDAPFSFFSINFGNNVDFSGAWFGDGLKFRHAKFGNNVSFNNATFGDGLSFTASTFGDKIKFNCTSFGNDINFTGSTFGDNIEFRDATFGDDISFTFAVFGELIEFNEATFGNRISFSHSSLGDFTNFSGATFGDDILYVNATLGDHVSFNAAFGARITFNQTKFGSHLCFSDAVFGDTISFNGAEFGDHIRFVNTTFGDNVVFNNATFGNDIDFNRAKFGNDTSFMDSTFGNTIIFRYAKFRGTVSFYRIKYGRNLVLDRIRIDKPNEWIAVDLSNASIRYVDFKHINLHGAILNGANMDGAKNLTLDSTSIRHTKFSANANDQWSVLRRVYTGPKMIITLMFLIVFSLPYASKVAFWVVVNKSQLHIDATARELVQSVEANAQKLNLPQSQIDELFPSTVQIRNRALCMNEECRDVPIWKLLVGADKGGGVKYLFFGLILFNVLKAFITYMVIPMREHEERTGYSPTYLPTAMTLDGGTLREELKAEKRSLRYWKLWSNTEITIGYALIYQLHCVVQVLFLFSLFTLFWNAYHWLSRVVWIPV